MLQQRVEAWVLDIVDQVVSGVRVEDDRVELKALWPSNHQKAARQIAGLANAAGGAPILWIVGLDEDGHKVVMPGDVEPSNWWNQVARRFAEVAPDPQMLRVPTSSGQVIALLMETDRAPYVVTTDGAGGVDREVPFRRGTGLRSAHRSEILRAVVREAEVPQLDPISGWVRVSRSPSQAADEELEREAVPEGVTIECAVAIYVDAVASVRLPEHRWALELAASNEVFDLRAVKVSGPTSPAGSSASGMQLWEPVGSIRYVVGSGIHIDGSDRIDIVASTLVPDPEKELEALFLRAKRLVLDAEFPLATSTRRAVSRMTFGRRARTPMSNRHSEAFREIDLRLGEFSFGGERPNRYHGRLERR